MKQRLFLTTQKIFWPHQLESLHYRYGCLDFAAEMIKETEHFKIMIDVYRKKSGIERVAEPSRRLRALLQLAGLPTRVISHGIPGRSLMGYYSGSLLGLMRNVINIVNHNAAEELSRPEF